MRGWGGGWGWGGGLGLGLGWGWGLGIGLGQGFGLGLGSGLGVGLRHDAYLLLACDVAQVRLRLKEGVEGREGFLGARLAES